MGSKRHSIVVVASGLVAGLIAGILTIVGPSSIPRWGPLIYAGALFGIFLGDIFGVFIAVYLSLVVASRSLLRVIGFIFASTFAYILAYYTTMFSADFIGFSNTPGPDYGQLSAAPVSAFFLGGTVGAFVVVLAALLHFPVGATLSRIFGKALLWSLWGGILGALGWASGPLLGGIVLRALGKEAVISSPGDGGTDYYYAIILVWQAGMGLVLGIVFTREKKRLTSQVSLPPLSAGAQEAIRTARVGMFVVTALVLCFFGADEFPHQYQSARWGRAYEKHVAETPSREGLREVEIRPTEQVLILDPFGENLPGRAYAGETNSIYDETGKRKTPKARMYGVRYSPPKRSDDIVIVGQEKYVDVHIEEYPNAAWAKFQLGEQGFATNLADIEKPLKFGNLVWAETKFLNQSGTGYYFWTSREYLIVIEFHEVDPEAFLKAYLQKYPSSLERT